MEFDITLVFVRLNRRYNLQYYMRDTLNALRLRN